MSQWGVTSEEWDGQDEEYSRGRRYQRRGSGSSASTSPDTYSLSVSNPSFGLVGSDDSMPEIVPLQKPWLSKRHLTNGNPSPAQAVHNRFHQWRLQDKLKTNNGAIVVCLNLDVDPPDVVKTQPCAVLEGWIDPRKLGSAKALEAIGKNLCQQFQSLNARIKYKPFLDPSIDETRRFCTNLRKAAKDERLCFYYNGHGVPKPTPSGELWVFNKTYSQYIPVSLYDLQSWLGSPVVYVWDCSAAGNLVTNLRKYAKQRDDAAKSSKQPRNVDPPPPHSSAIQLAACLASETLPMAPDMPADMFTSCLTSPIEMALRFYYLHQSPPPGVTIDMLHEVPGDLKDRRTPLGELNWIFTAVTDTIAWTSFSRPIFKKLFRQDLLVAALFRNFLLAERIMRNYHCTPHTVPELPSTATHPLWAAWDRSVEDIIKQLPDLIKASKPSEPETIEIVEGRPFVPLPFKYEYKSSSFFTDHLTAFELWMSRGGGALTKPGPWSMPPLEKMEDEEATPMAEEPPTQPDLVPRKPPAQLPILLQVLLSQAHRMRALTLLCQFVDLGPWAVHLVLEIGIYPYVQKLLLSPQGDLKPLLIFIWSRLIAFDKSCQIDLLREMQFSYFATILDYSNPVGLAYTFEYRSMCAFILASLCRDHPPGQAACLGWNKGALLDFYLHHIVNSSDFLLKQWCCLAIAQLWDANNEAKELALDQGVQTHLLGLLNDDASAEVRAAALYALAIFEGASGSANVETTGGNGTGRMRQLSEYAHLEVEFDTAVTAVRITKSDASPIVRKEAVVLISALVDEWRGYFIVAAWIYWEEEQKSSSKSDGGSDDVADRAIDDWMASLRCSDMARRQQRDYLKKIFVLLTYLYDLVVDPHMEVATLATTVVDFVVAMLLESPFSRIQGTSIRRSSLATSISTRRPSSGSTGVNASRQASMTSITPSTLTTALQPLQRAESTSQVPTRASFGIMRNSSIANALGTLAGFTRGTHSTDDTAPPSPSQSQTSDVEIPPAPACSLARYTSPYQTSTSPESSTSMLVPSSVPRTSSFQSIGPISPLSNGHSYSSTDSTQITNRYTPADIVNALIARDLIKFAVRRRAHHDGLSGNQRHLWHDFDVDQDRLNNLEDLGLDAGATLVQTVPLKSKLYDWALEYYKEPQMRQLDEDEPGSLSYTRQLWRRNRDDEIIRAVTVQGDQAPRRSWSYPHGSWKLPFAPTRMTFHHFDPHVAVCDEGAHVSVYDWKASTRISGFNNGNPKGTSITSLHFVDEEVGGAVVVGSSDGVVRIYNNFDPAYSDGNPVQLVSGFRALAMMNQATKGVGLISEWNQTLTRLLCGGDSEYIYDWDAMTERCVTTIQTEESCPLTTMSTNPHSRRSFIAGFGNGAIKVFDTRARSVQATCTQNRREHRSWIANVRYQSGASKQILSASADGVVNLWDLRYTDGVVQRWDAFPEGLQSFDVHPNTDVFIASSSFARSWRNISVVIQSFVPAQRGHPALQSNGFSESPPPILSTSFSSGLTAPSRAHPHAPNLHFTHSCLSFHPTQMMFAIGTADGMIRLQGCQFSKGKDHYVPEAESKPHAGLGLTNGGGGYLNAADGRVDFPTMR